MASNPINGELRRQPVSSQVARTLRNTIRTILRQPGRFTDDQIRNAVRAAVGRKPEPNEASVPKVPTVFDRIDGLVNRWRAGEGLLPVNGKVENAGDGKPCGESFISDDKVCHLQDFGAKIGGAKKDLWKLRGLSTADFDTMTGTEQAKFSTKKEIFPNPDYAKLIEDGMPTPVAFLVKTVKDSIAPEPKLSKAEMLDPVVRAAKQRRYVELVSTLKNKLATVKDHKDIRAVWQQMFPAEPGQTYSPSLTPQANSDAILLGGNKFASAMQVNGYDLVKAARKIEKTGWPEKQEQWERQFELQQVPIGTEIWTKAEGDKVTTEESWEVTRKGKHSILASFKSKEEATEFAKSQVAKKKAEPTRPMNPDTKRKGADHRNGKDVSGNDILEVFGFRGGEFGNWTNDADRQQALNQSFDALHDLAGVLGIPPKAISLNGELGIAFGARGGGKAAAHYEPGSVVINLTRTRGSGSLGHEWAHAMDDYFGRMASNGLPGNWISHGNKGNVRPEVLAAWNDVMKTITERPKTNAEIIADTQPNIDRSRRNIDGWLREFNSTSKDSPQSGFIKDTVAMLKLEKPRTDAAGNPLLPDALVKSLVEVSKQIPGAKIPNETAKAVAGNASYLDGNVRRIAKAEKGEIHDTAPTRFLAASEAQGEYWHRKEELFARAFEAHLAQSIENKQESSPYLVYGVPTKSSPVDDEWGDLYPRGDEAERSNAAFKKLFSAIHVTDGKVLNRDAEEKDDEPEEIILVPDEPLDYLGDAIQNIAADHPTFDYGILMFVMDPCFAGPFQAWAKEKISKDDLAKDGVEKETHLTVLWGFEKGFDVALLNLGDGTVGGWIGCDLDGVLALTDDAPFDPQKIGEPVPLMIERVKQWLADGKTVKIMTARANTPGQAEMIQDWLEANGLPRLEVTATKDKDMVALYDDRAFHVTPNTGIIAEEISNRVAAILPPGPIEAEVERIVRFQVPAKGYDVIVLKINSPAVVELNQRLVAALGDGVNKSEFTYNPHITLAYVKPGAAPGIEDDPRFNGMKFKLSVLTFRPAENTGDVDIPLGEPGTVTGVLLNRGNGELLNAGDGKPCGEGFIAADLTCHVGESEKQGKDSAFEERLNRLVETFPEEIDDPVQPQMYGDDSVEFEYEGKTWTATLDHDRGTIRYEDEAGDNYRETVLDWDETAGNDGEGGYIEGNDVDSAGDVSGDIWEKVPSEWWDNSIDVKDPDQWEKYYTVQHHDEEMGGWHNEDGDEKHLSLRSALKSFDDDGATDKRLVYFDGTKSGYGSNEKWDFQVVARPSFVSKLLDTFPGMTKQEARSIAKTRNPENEDPFLVAQAWARHNLTDYDSKLAEAKNQSGDEHASDAERNKARREIKEKVDGQMAKWRTEKTENIKSGTISNSGPRTGVPCGDSHIAMDKVCHVGEAAQPTGGGAKRLDHDEWVKSLTDQEQQVIKVWTGNSYKGMRHAQKVMHEAQNPEEARTALNDEFGSTMAGAYIRAVKVVEDAIARAKPYCCDPVYRGVVFRGDRTQEVAKLTTGSVVTLRAMSSATRDFNVAHRFAVDVIKEAPVEQVIFEFKNTRSAVDIHDLSDWPDEKEAILPSKTSFKVTERRYDKQMRAWVVTAEEIERLANQGSWLDLLLEDDDDRDSLNKFMDEGLGYFDITNSRDDVSNAGVACGESFIDAAKQCRVGGQPERIKAAAIRVGDRVFTGITHVDAVEKAAAEGALKGGDTAYFDELDDAAGMFDEDGFVTTTGRFVSRDEAYEIARKATQILDWKDDRRLASEDLANAIRLEFDLLNNTEPTDAQAEAGNYKKRHLTIDGLRIAVETEKGETRSGTDPNGEPWSVVMPVSYGEIKGTIGADGDRVDCYLSDDAEEAVPAGAPVYLIRQVDADTGRFDEYKVMLGFGNVGTALAAYRGAFSDGRAEDRIGDIETLELDEFKERLKKEMSNRGFPEDKILNYDPNQQRADDGKWTDTGKGKAKGFKGKASAKDILGSYSKPKPELPQEKTGGMSQAEKALLGFSTQDEYDAEGYPLKPSQKTGTLPGLGQTKLPWQHQEKYVPKPVSKWRSAGAVVVNDEGKIAIRKPTGGFGGHTWTFPKGRLDPNETKESAAHREVEEEAGLKGDLGEHLGEHSGEASITDFYLMHLKEDTGKHDKETAEIKWVTPEEAAMHLDSVRDLRVLVKAMIAIEKAKKAKLGNRETAGLATGQAVSVSQTKHEQFSFEDTLKKLANTGAPDQPGQPCGESFISSEKVCHVGEQSAPQPGKPFDPNDIWNPKLVSIGHWNKANNSAQWAAKKISLIEFYLNKGDADGIAVLKQMDTTPKSASPNSYQKAVHAAHQKALAILTKETPSLEAVGTAAKTEPPTEAKVKEAVEKAVENKEVDAKKDEMLSLSDLTKVGGQKGSNPGGLYQAKDGTQYYVKFSKSNLHAENEILTAKLYEAAGQPVPEYKAINLGEGKIGTASKWLGKGVSFNPSNINDAHEAQVGFATHAWLANWDAMGASNDNQVWVKPEGKGAAELHTIDTGGGLLYRAQGGAKGKDFNDKVNEWDNLRNPDVNSKSGAVFQDMTAEQLKASAAKVGAVKDSTIAELVNKHMTESSGLSQKAKNALAARIIARKYQVVAKGDGMVKSPTEAKPEPVTALPEPPPAPVPAPPVPAGFTLPPKPPGIILTPIPSISLQSKYGKKAWALHLLAEEALGGDPKSLQALKDVKKPGGYPLGDKTKVYKAQLIKDVEEHLAAKGKEGTPTLPPIQPLPPIVQPPKENNQGSPGPTVGPKVPPPPLVNSASNPHAQKNLDKIYDAAKTGDITKVEAIYTNSTSTQTYSKKTHDYKMAVLAAMQAGGHVSKEALTPAVSKASTWVPKLDVSTVPKPMAVPVAPGSGIPKPPDFANYNGPGKGLSSHPEKNKANQEEADHIYGLAKTAEATGNLKPLEDHVIKSPSSKMVGDAGYKAKVLDALKYKDDIAKVAGLIAAGDISALNALKSPSKSVQSLVTSGVEHLEQKAIYNLAIKADLQGVKGFTPSASGGYTVASYKESVLGVITEALTPPPPPPKVFDGGINDIVSEAHAIPPGKIAAAEKAFLFVVTGNPGVSIEYPSLKGKFAPKQNFNSKELPKHEAAWQSLTQEERDLIVAYTGNTYYKKWNDSFKDDKPNPSALKVGKALMKAALPIPEGTFLSRKLNPLKEIGTYDSLPFSQVKTEALGMIGKVIQEPGISSSSTDPSQWGGNLHMRIYAGKGLRGLHIAKHSKYGHESELVFPPNTRYWVQNVYEENGKMIAHVVAMATQDHQCC